MAINLSDRFEIGTTVANFGFNAWVIGYHADSLILEDSKGVKWLADPDKCVCVIGKPYARRRA